MKITYNSAYIQFYLCPANLYCVFLPRKASTQPATIYRHHGDDFTSH